MILLMVFVDKSFFLTGNFIFFKNKGWFIKECFYKYEFNAMILLMFWLIDSYYFFCTNYEQKFLKIIEIERAKMFFIKAMS